jgi:Domain of unknown function (DUF4357)
VSDGRQIRIFLVDGTPGGLLTAEIMNWTGHVVAAPRSDLARLLRREETSRTGVYVLLGDDPEALGQQLAYIGEGDEVRDRLAQHARSEKQGGKDFWDRAIVLTSKDANLTKAHARYLESQFISLATQAGRSRLTNATAPPRPLLPEADRSDMEYYIAQAKIILPVLGINLLRATTVLPGSSGPVSGQPTVASPTFTLHLKKEGIIATAREIDGEFTVLQGSHARQSWVSTPHAYKALHEALVKDEVLVPDPVGGPLRFARDYVFASPSAAAAVVTGRNANGRIEWRIQGSGMNFGDWQLRDIDSSEHAASS